MLGLQLVLVTLHKPLIISLVCEVALSSMGE